VADKNKILPKNSLVKVEMTCDKVGDFISQLKEKKSEDVAI
jgi:hypothetical protein